MPRESHQWTPETELGESEWGQIFPDQPPPDWPAVFPDRPADR